MTDQTESEGHEPTVELEAGWRHLSEGRWDAAEASFRSALAQAETPEALEGLSWAAWWVDDAETVFDARERAFRSYREEGRRRSAARVAIWIAADHLDFRGEGAVAGGWLRRASRLLQGVEGGPEHGWLAFHEGYLASLAGDHDRAVRLAVRAAELGSSIPVPDLEMLGLGLHGAVLVSTGSVSRGMALLDEATAAAMSGDAELPISCAWTFCFLVSACDQVRDYPRAFEWCRPIEEFARRYGSRYMLGFCRTHYGVVDLVAGRWAEAEAALNEAVEAASRSRPASVPMVLRVLAELRRRQGRWDDAERLLDEAGPGGGALACRARLALDRGETLRAAELAERRLRALSPERRLPRAAALEVLVTARAALGDLDQAAEALAELEDVAETVNTPLLRAAADHGAGVLAGASGEHDRARRRLEDACDRFLRHGAPFEAALTGIELARTFAALGRDEPARREARRALDQLVDLGAKAEARRARRVLEALEGRPPALPELTPREREVLRLVARGLTNREIAERLFISEHTVHRHVANILGKLDLPSRTAAASRAAQAGLLDDPLEPSEGA